MSELSHYLLLDHLKISAANAISSPLTYGFPAISGFLGAIHALNRRLQEDLHNHPELSELKITLDGVLIACHQCDVQRYRHKSYEEYHFIKTRNPLLASGKTAPIIEEGRVNLEVSLVIEVLCDGDLSEKAVQNQLCEIIRDLLMQQRMAGGTIEPITSIQNIRFFDAYAEKGNEPLLQSLLPAYVLMEANSELEEIMEKLQSESEMDITILDAFLELSLMRYTPTVEQVDSKNIEEEEAEEQKEITEKQAVKVKWTAENIKRGRGWLVPIAVGYQGIYPSFDKGVLEGVRTKEYLSQYTEVVYGLGKWLSPYRLRDQLESAFWRYQKVEEDFYLLSQTRRN